MSTFSSWYTAQLPSFWETNHRSLINYMKEATYGIRGIVTDSLSGEPLRAFIQVEGHDRDSSQIHSSAIHGGYFRPIAAGTYDLRFSAPGYKTQTIRNIEATDFSYTVQNVLLAPESHALDTVPQDSVANESLQQIFPRQEVSCRLYPNPVSATLHIEGNEPISLQAVYRASDGRKVLRTRTKDFQWTHLLDVSTLPSGTYILKIETGSGALQRLRFITH